MTWDNEKKNWLLTAFEKKTVPSTILRTLARPLKEAGGMTLLLLKALFLRAKVRKLLIQHKEKRKKSRGKRSTDTTP